VLRAIKRTFCAAGRVTPSRARRAIPAISPGRSTRNPPLTTADGEETIPKVPLEFPCFNCDTVIDLRQRRSSTIITVLAELLQNAELSLMDPSPAPA
jgi:hypothetical protein